MKKIDSVKFWVYMAFRALLIHAAVMAVLRGSWINFVVTLSTLFLTFLPSIIERKFKVDYPSEFEIIILLFIYSSVYLGDMHDYYLKFRWWDTLLHAISGIIFGAIGFSLIYILNKSQKIIMKLSDGFLAGFAFCFSLTAGTLWEIYEFLMDEYFGMQLQRFGLNDTMWDLILDASGAVCVSLAGYFYLKGKAHFLELVVNRFARHNPRFFRK